MHSMSSSWHVWVCVPRLIRCMLHTAPHHAGSSSSEVSQLFNLDHVINGMPCIQFLKRVALIWDSTRLYFPHVAHPKIVLFTRRYDDAYGNSCVTATFMLQELFISGDHDALQQYNSS